eukprot:m.244677 g.244677  ORF g.244677 m.244677 type:complete len:134 (-) comp55706_c0_seq1:43-444(-)
MSGFRSKPLGEVHQTLAVVLQKLPPINFFTLYFFIQHLKKLSKYESATLMNAEKLGVVVGPTIMFSRDPLTTLAQTKLPAHTAWHLITLPSKMWGDLNKKFMDESNLITNISVRRQKKTKNNKKKSTNQQHKK